MSPGCSTCRASASRGQTLPLLFELARAADLPGRIAAMFRGDPINTTEQRAVLHTALRSDFAGLGGHSGGGARVAPGNCVDFVARGAPRPETRDHGQEIQACREHRHRRLGFGAAAGVRCAAGGVERRHHAALRLERGSHAARGFDPQHRSRRRRWSSCARRPS